MVEWKASHKANTFADKRIGENVPGLTEEEKAFARFQRQASQQFLKKSKKAKFNIDDGGGEWAVCRSRSCSHCRCRGCIRIRNRSL